MMKSLIRLIKIMFANLSAYHNRAGEKLTKRLLARHLLIGWDYQFSFECAVIDFYRNYHIFMNTVFKNCLIFFTIRFNK